MVNLSLSGVLHRSSGFDVALAMEEGPQMLVPRDVALGVEEGLEALDSLDVVLAMEEGEGYALGCAFLVALRISRLLLVSLDEELRLFLMLPDRIGQRHVWNLRVHLGPVELELLAVVVVV